MSEIESLGTHYLCGICDKPVSGANTQDDLSYTKQCPLCNVEYYHCMQCVKHISVDTNQNITTQSVY